jgi:hypothetical protein
VKTDHAKPPSSVYLAGISSLRVWNIACSHSAEMLTWTELAAYLSVVVAVCGGGAALYWAVLWRE